ncbi:MAG: TolC family protein [Phycisphaerales bacterium]|nr:TolC family protein [Phycisphaerales bacterium]
MSHCARPPARRVFAGLGPSIVSIFVAAGCHSARPDPATEATIAFSAGLQEPVVLRTGVLEVDEPDAGSVLPLADAVRRAVLSDPALQAALARVRIAMADADQERLLPNPILNVVVRWGPGEPQIEASLAQDLIRTLQAPRRASAADHRLRSAAAEAVAVVIDVIAEVEERYASAQADDRLLPLFEGRLELLRKLEAVAARRLEAGEGTRGDLSTLQAQRVELEVEIAEAQRRRQEDRLRLARLVGEPSGTASWMLDSWSAPDVSNQPEAHWVDAAMLHRPEIQSAIWKLAALGDEQALATLHPWEDASIAVDTQKDGDWTTGPAISTPIPIFDMGQARAARISAERLEARHDLVRVRREVVEEVRTAYRSLAACQANLTRVRDDLIPLQRQRRQQAEDAYRAGQSDVTSLFLAEHDLRASEAREIEVAQQTTMARVRLQRAVGGPGVARAIGVAAAQPATAEPPVTAQH